MSEYWRGVWSDPLVKACVIAAVILVIITILGFYYAMDESYVPVVFK